MSKRTGCQLAGLHPRSEDWETGSAAPTYEAVRDVHVGGCSLRQRHLGYFFLFVVVAALPRAKMSRDGQPRQTIQRSREYKKSFLTKPVCFGISQVKVFEDCRQSTASADICPQGRMLFYGVQHIFQYVRCELRWLSCLPR